MHYTTDTKNKILSLLADADIKGFIDHHFADTFVWTITGRSDLSGTYHDRETFLNQVLGRLAAKTVGAWSMDIHQSYATDACLIVEMTGKAQTTDGNHYVNDYCWIMHFDHDKISKLVAYYDSLEVNQTLNLS